MNNLLCMMKEVMNMLKSKVLLDARSFTHASMVSSKNTLNNRMVFYNKQILLLETLREGNKSNINPTSCLHILVLFAT